VNLRRQTRRWLFHPTYWAFVSGGLALLVFLLKRYLPEQLPWPALTAMFTFLVVADSKLAASQVSGGRVMSSKCVVLSVIALFGPAVAAGMEAVSAPLRGLLQKRLTPRKAVFNAAMLASAAGVAGLVYRVLPFTDRYDSPLIFIPLAGAMLAHSIVNSLMLGVIISLDGDMPLARVYRHSFAWAKLRVLLDLPFAAMIIMLYNQGGAWTLLLFLFPVLALYQSDRQYQRTREAHVNSIAALTTALEADDEYTHGHSTRVATLAVRVGQAMSMGDRDLEDLEYGALLHDIGKLAISNDIIKKPNRLTDAEFETIKTHPTIGADIVVQIKSLAKTTDLVRHHHERPDGRGYPHGLKQDEISIGCAILNVCDAFDAMTTDRPYRKALSVEKTMEELVRFKSTQFDERVVDIMLSLYHQGEFDDVRDIRVPEPVFPAEVPRPSQQFVS
jgi:putative nucleotidyltransferase with HDIG domain